MKEFSLQDMTKPELIKIIIQSFFHQPTQKELMYVRWESLCAESQAIMAEAIAEQGKQVGKSAMDSRIEWMKASDRFDEGTKVGDKADALLAEIKAIAG